MVKSMTGFGRGEIVAHGRRICVELKSVNHKFYEFSFKGPRAYAFLEDKLKAFLQESISRGKVDCFLTVETLESPDVQITVNHALASAYVEALRELAGRYGVADATTAESLSRFPDVLSVTKAPEDEEQIWQDVQQAVQQALTSFLAMREAEEAPACVQTLKAVRRPFFRWLQKLKSVRPRLFESIRPVCRQSSTKCWAKTVWMSSAL